MSTSTPQEEHSILEQGIDVSKPDRSTGPSFISNLPFINGRFQVRGGWGLLRSWSTGLNSAREALNTALGESPEWGYQGAPLCSIPYKSDDGRERIVSVHRVKAYTAMTYNPDSRTRGPHIAETIVVSILDTTDRSVQEFPLCWDTRNNTTQNLTQVLPAGLSSDTVSIETWVDAARLSGEISAFEFRDTVYIILPGIGVWTLRTTLAPTQITRLRGVDNTAESGQNRNDWRGESATLRPVHWSTGLYRDSYTYFDDATMPIPTCGCVYQGSVTWANGKTLYFSDVDSPTQVAGANVYVMPTQEPIIGMKTIKGILVVWTATETWAYQPSDPSNGGLYSGGAPFQMSASVGIIGPRHCILGDDAIFWVSSVGVYATVGGTDIEKISDKIDPWFTSASGISNPHSSFIAAAANGTPWGGINPTLNINILAELNSGAGQCTWDYKNKMLWCGFQTFALLWSQASGWTLHLLETVVKQYNSASNISPRIAIESPMIVAVPSGNIFAICGPKTGTWSVNGHTLKDNPCIAVQLGRGGSLDLSAIEAEDQREPIGGWARSNNIIAPDALFYVCEPTYTDKGRVFADQEVLPGTKLWSVPVELGIGSDTLATGLKTIELIVKFDKDNFEPLLKSGTVTSEVEFILPSQRLASATGWLVQRWDTGTSGHSDTGDAIRLSWDWGRDTNTTRTGYPYIQVRQGERNPLLFIQMKTLSVDSSSAVDFNWSYDTGNVRHTYEVPAVYAPAYFWQGLDGNLGSKGFATGIHTQPVDWAYKSRSFGDGAVQLKYRGTFIRLQSNGEDVTSHQTAWPWGPLNTSAGSDWRDWSGQTVDWGYYWTTGSNPADNGISDINDMTSVRNRMKAPLTSEMHKRLGGEYARWSSLTDTTKGNFLVDDQPVDTIATSESVRGESFSTMLFGYNQSPAERVEVTKAVVQVKEVGGRRRTGRTGRFGEI